MISLDKQMTQLPQEFVDEMYLQRDQRFEDAYASICKIFDIGEDVEQLEMEGIPFKTFIRRIFEIGYYNGINFAIDPQEPYKS